MWQIVRSALRGAMVAVLLSSMLSLTATPAQASASPTCAQGGTCVVGNIGPAGGIVIYVGSSTIDEASGISSGGIYLEAAPAGFTTASYNWCDGENNGNTTLIGANNAAVGAGASNTATMVLKCTAGAGNVAANYSVNGFSDWFLPSGNELLLLNSQKNLVGINNNTLYWGSNEAETWIAASLVTWVNAIGGQNKAGATPLWPIRAFSPGQPLMAPRVTITRASAGTERSATFTTQPQITIQDVNRNVDTSSSVVVTASVSTGGTLTGTITATASSGIATFSNLGIDGTIGQTYTITFSAPDLSSTTMTVTLTGITCDGSSFTCRAGDTGPGGGKIFYVDSGFFTQLSATSSMCLTTCKYLEAAPKTWFGGTEDPGISWSTGDNQTIAVTGARDTAIGSGYKNSIAIVAQSGNIAASSAAVAARAYTGGSKTDWFLPSKDELNEMFINRSFVDPSSGYWSSSEYSFNGAWDQGFGNGVQGVAQPGKHQTTPVRPIRAFGPPPPATKVSITQASVGTQRNTAFTAQPQITIQDASSNTVTNSSALVTATISAGGTLIGTTTATASSGVATFNNLGLDGTVGSTYTITYTAVGLTVATATVTLTGTTCDGTTFTCQVGDTGPGGGKIFYVAPTFFTQQGATGNMCTTKCKYLESAPTTGTANWTDANYAWSGNTNTLIGASAQGTAIGTGYQNTLAIVGQDATPNKAGTITRAYRGPNNKSDWFLPSKDELNQLRVQRTVVSAPPVGAPHSNYWSSTEASDTEAIYEYFLLTDHYVPYVKSHATGIFVRPIRAFGALPTTISDAAIAGVTAPATGATPVTTTTVGTGYTGSVSWSGSPTNFASSTIYTATITLTATADYTFSGVSANFFTIAGATSVSNLANSGIVTASFPTTAPLAPTVIYIAPTPVPYLKTLTTPKINLQNGKLVCAPGTYNAGFSLDGVIQGSGTSLFTPSSFTYNLLINGITQTSFTIVTSAVTVSWNLPVVTSGALLSCSVTVSANGVANTDKSTDNGGVISSALSIQTAAISAANAAYIAGVLANEKAYQKALVDNRTNWRKQIDAIRSNYYETLNRIKSSGGTKMVSDISTALKVMIAAQKKSAADYRASQPTTASVRDSANKAAFDSMTAAITRAKAAYGTFIESIGYGILIS